MIVIEILVPKQPAGYGTAFLKFLPATQDDYATVSVAARVALDGDGTVAERLTSRLTPAAALPAERSLALSGTLLFGRRGASHCSNRGTQPS